RLPEETTAPSQGTARSAAARRLRRAGSGAPDAKGLRRSLVDGPDQTQPVERQDQLAQDVRPEAGNCRLELLDRRRRHGEQIDDGQRRRTQEVQISRDRVEDNALVFSGPMTAPDRLVVECGVAG